jgi:hypothetical protein
VHGYDPGAVFAPEGRNQKIYSLTGILPAACEQHSGRACGRCFYPAKCVQLFVKPHSSSNWDEFAAEIMLHRSKYRISVSKASHAQGYTLPVKGSEVADPKEGYPVG